MFTVTGNHDYNSFVILDWGKRFCLPRKISISKWDLTFLGESCCLPGRRENPG